MWYTRRMGWPGVMKVLAVWGMAAGASVAAATSRSPVVVLNSAAAPPLTSPDHTGFLDDVVREAFRRIGVGVRLLHLPAERALWLANAGFDDGELVRIAGLERTYPNLVRVPVPVVTFRFSAFTYKHSSIDRFSAIRRESVGLITGWKIYERHMAGALMVTTVDSPRQLFRLLDTHRISVALYERDMGLALIKREHLKGIHVLRPPLAQRPMYIYLNRRDRPLVSPLAQALRTLKADGYYRRAYRGAMRASLGQHP